MLIIFMHQTHMLINRKRKERKNKVPLVQACSTNE